MPSPGPAQPVRDAKCATVAVGRSDSEDRSAAVAESCPGTLKPRRPDERRTEARHVGGGLEAGLGTRSEMETFESFGSILLQIFYRFLKLRNIIFFVTFQRIVESTTATLVKDMRISAHFQHS